MNKDKLEIERLKKKISELEQSLNYNLDERQISHTIIDTSNAIIVGLDINHKIILFNKGAERITGYTQSEVFKKDWFKLFLLPEMFVKIDKVWKQTWENQHSSFENSIIAKNGNHIDVSWQSSKIYQSAGFNDFILCIGKDVTLRNSTLSKLKESKELATTVLENSPIGISVRDKNGTLLLSNNAWKKIWGLSDKEIIKYKKPKKKLKFNKKDSYLGEHTKRIEDIYKNGGEYIVKKSKLLVKKLGKAIYVRQHFKAILDEKGAVARVVILTEDITGHILAKEKLLKNEEKYRKIFEYSPIGILSIDLNGNPIDCNKSTLRILGSPSIEATKKINVLEFQNLKDVGFDVDFKECSSSGKVIRKQVEYISLWKKRAFVNYILVPVFDNNNKIQTIQCFFEDISELKKKEQQLQKRVEYIDFISKLSTKFINIEKEKLDGAIIELLQTTVNFAGIQRGYVFLLSKDGESLNLTHQWCCDNGVNNKELVSFIKVTEIKDFIDDLTNNPIITLCTKDIRKTNRKRRLLNNLKDIGTKCFVEIPIFINNKLVGYIGFDSIEKEMNWTPEIIDGFKLCKMIISNAIEQKDTEQQLKGYAESQELLLNEVNHRVKNNLYSLTGMLYKEKDKILKTKSKKDTIFIDDLISRIDGLAKVHNLLSASKWKPLNLSVLVNELTYNYFKNSLSEELNVNVKKHQKEMVNSYQAQHFALVYNEILTNIVKYCGINLDDLNINCKITSNKDYIFVRIRDNGVGFNKKILSGDYSEAGIGFDLIFGILKKSLAGSVEIENNNGAVYKLKFKKRI